MTSTRVAMRVVVQGRVQGVCFRAATRAEAERRGVTGWVRNQPDGSVEAVFEGSHQHVDAMLAFVRQGPPAASVSDVASSDCPPEGSQDFEIRR